MKSHILKIFAFAFFLLGLAALEGTSFFVRSSFAEGFAIAVNVSEDVLIESGQGNIFTIEVAFAQNSGSSSEQYNVLYFIDDRFEEEFKGQGLPFSFKRNLKGQRAGAHTMRIDVEDPSGNVLSSSSVSVDVSVPGTPEN